MANKHFFEENFNYGDNLFAKMFTISRQIVVSSNITVNNDENIEQFTYKSQILCNPLEHYQSFLFAFLFRFTLFLLIHFDRLIAT